MKCQICCWGKVLWSSLNHLLIFNSIVTSYTYPTVWKSTNIVPVPKCNQVELKNLRPISILPNLSKLFEKYLVWLLSPCLEMKNDPSHFGFKKNCKISSALVNLFNDITIRLEDTKIESVSIVSFDFSKTLETIDFGLLLKNYINFYYIIFFC